MKPLSYKWNKTKNIYLDWLLKNDLKKNFQKVYVLKIYHYGG